MIKKLFFITLFALSLFLSQAPKALAAEPVSQTVIAQNFDMFNPLNPDIGGGTAENKEELSTPGGILSRVLRYAIPIAGLILFVMIVWGGFEMVASSASAKKDAGRQRITAAVIGFILLFSAYWIAQIVQAAFGIKFLS